MNVGPSGAALALTALAVFAFRASGLALASRLGPRSPLLAWASAVSYALLAVYVTQTLVAPTGSLQVTPVAARLAAAALAVAGFTSVGRGLFQWLVIGAAAFSLGLGAVPLPRGAAAANEAAPAARSEPAPSRARAEVAVTPSPIAEVASIAPALAFVDRPPPGCAYPVPFSRAFECAHAFETAAWPRVADACWPAACGSRDWLLRPFSPATIERPPTRRGVGQAFSARPKLERRRVRRGN